MAQKITEESGVHKEWMVEAKKQTMATLPEFLRKLTEDFEHDYGTICHAVAAAAIGAAWAVERTAQGGITRFQAGAIMWEIIKGWGVFDDGPKKMVCYSNMLYPQYADSFDKEISSDTWEWLQERAKKNLVDEPRASDAVIAHWKDIASGKVPFGFCIRVKGE